MDGDAAPGPQELQEQADQLKERVYVTFTALAVVLALRGHEVEAARALSLLGITVLGTVLAVFTADVVSHIAVHAQVPHRAALRHMVRVSFGALGAVALPFGFLLLAALEVWEVAVALRASSIALVAALVAIGYLAARRARLSAVQRAVVLLAEFLLGVAVIGLELLAHA
ncbi:hypothetical protein [Nocardioides sp. GXQ0305]|uniref:hypothetical protein n=1 Tax=Nocardioides sp. GXQ0305 TaxID=3423912 RepID=UPI003D7C8FDD